MSDDIFNLDDFVSQGPVVEVKKAPQEKLKEDNQDSKLLKELVDAVKAVPEHGKDGLDGLDGANGADGVGIDGAKGLDGSNGSDGVSVVDTFVQGDDLFMRLSDGKLINAGDVRGPQGHQGMQGSGGGGKGYRGGGFDPKKSNQVANSLVYVTQTNVSTTLGGTIDSSKQYVIDGIIDMTGVQIEVPQGGLYISGHNFDVSQLVSDEDGATMFHSLASGNVLMFDIGITMSGVGSQVYDLKSNTGFDAIEVLRINYNNCTSLGTLDNFRQGLETGTGRFGGKPELTLKGTWVGGFFIATSIVRSLTAGTYSLFKAGVGFTMASRFRSDMNVDLPAGVTFVDFAVANFPNPSTLQFAGMLMTRAGASNPTDALYHPNISARDLPCLFTDNNGLENTYVGAVLIVTTENVTTISTAGAAVALTAPIYSISRAAHFDTPANGELRHLGNSPREYSIILDLRLEGQANAEVRLELWKYTASTASDAQVKSFSRQVNSFVGGRDVCFFSNTAFLNLEVNDKMYFKVANVTNTVSVTLELGSTIIVGAR